MLTEFVENVVLGGRRLDLLRLISLVGAIPAVLGTRRSVSKNGGSPAVNEASLAKSSGSGSSDGGQTGSGLSDIEWAQFALSGASSILSALSGVAAWWEQEALELRVLTSVGVLGIVTAGLDLAVADQLSGRARDLAIAAASIALTGSVVVVAAGVAKMAAASSEATAGAVEKIEQAELVADAVLGLGEVAVASLQLAESPEEVGAYTTIALRAYGWVCAGVQRASQSLALDAPKIAAVGTISSAIAGFAVDLADVSMSG